MFAKIGILVLVVVIIYLGVSIMRRVSGGKK